MTAPILTATITGGWSDDAHITLQCAGERATWPYLASSGQINRPTEKTKMSDAWIEESAWDNMARWLTPLLHAG